MRLVVDAQGILKRVADASPAGSAALGSCEPGSLTGLDMPAPPGAAVLEIGLADILVRRRAVSSGPPEE
jgi:hypothetical protein